MMLSARARKICVQKHPHNTSSTPELGEVTQIPTRWSKVSLAVRLSLSHPAHQQPMEGGGYLIGGET